MTWAAALALVDPASAQYDRERRYVPAPLGVPADPFARPIPLYSGKPGAANGTPIVPRGAIPDGGLAPISPRPALPRAGSARSLPVVIDVEHCKSGWTKAMGVTRVAFDRRCSFLERRR